MAVGTDWWVAEFGENKAMRSIGAPVGVGLWGGVRFYHFGVLRRRLFLDFS